MLLQSFQVQGYKNLRAPLPLPDLNRFNMLHGDNNVGKSNLLESIGLFFVAIQALREEARSGPSLEERYARRAPPVEAAPDGRPPRAVVRSFDYFTREGYPPGEIFNLGDARPIVLEAQIELDHGEGDPPWLGKPIIVSVRLEREEGEVTVQITGLKRTLDGADLAIGTGDQAATDTAFALVLERVGQRVRGKESVPRFALVRADRTITGEAPEGASPLATREPLPRSLARTLHDAENATDARRARFKRFVAALGHFQDLVGPGQWRMRFDTDADRAELCLDTGTELLPLRLMGSGIQQLAALCARLVMTGADIIAIEEPELNLRWSVQRALSKVLHEIVDSPGGPSQLILTSHSGQFEEEPTFYLLTRAEDGPHIHKKPAEEAWIYTQPGAPPPPSGTRATLGYLTIEGVVQVPPEVQQQLELSHGGGVVFVRGQDGHYRMLTNDQYADLFEGSGAAAVTGDEIAARLGAGSVVLAFDTNAVYRDRRLNGLCDRVARHNLRLTAGGRAPVRLVISTVAYAEKLFDLKQRWRDTFDLDVILDGLRSKGIEVQPFDARHALETAKRLGERYPNDAAWQRAKRDRCLRCLGLPPSAAPAPGTGRTCGATVDWHIGGHARAEGCVLVTDDNDLELSGLLERVGLDTLEAALRRLSGEPA